MRRGLAVGVTVVSLWLVTSAAATQPLAIAGRAVASTEADIVLAQATANPIPALQAQIAQLEQRVRTLTGRVEEAEFRNRQLEDRLERLARDYEARLQALEGGADVAAAQADSDGQEPLIEDTPTSPDQTTTPRVPGSLGTVREGDLATVPPAPPSSDGSASTAQQGPQERYDTALNLLQVGNLDAARTGLSQFLDRYPEHPLAANAAYWLAEVHYAERDYAQAARAFASNFQTYGVEANKAGENLLKLGMSLEALGQSEQACVSYSKLEELYSNPPANLRAVLIREQGRAGCG